MLEKVVKLLIEKNKTLSIMESCTGGHISDLITNIEGASKVLVFSCVPYSDEYKIKFGVRESTIREYTANSLETAKEMGRCISSYTKSDFGIGITGTITKASPLDPTPPVDTVYISIYKRETNQIFVSSLNLINATHEEKKNDIAAFIRDTMSKLI